MAVLERDVLASIPPLVRTALAHLVREVVVVEVDAVVVVVKVLPVLLAVHEDLHGLAPLLDEGDEEDAADRVEHLDELDPRREEVVEKALRILPEGHRLETILRVEMLDWINRGVVDAANCP